LATVAFGVFYVRLGVELSLTEPDQGYPGDPGLWDQLYRRTPPGTLQCIECHTHSPLCPEWMYLRIRRERREAVHYNREIGPHIEGTDCPRRAEWRLRGGCGAASRAWAAPHRRLGLRRQGPVGLRAPAIANLGPDRRALGGRWPHANSAAVRSVPLSSA